MKTNASRPVHRWPVRITHWINLFAMVCMFMSGWEIYNASPLFDFRFPPQMTLGGWLGGAIGWHLAAMWLLALNGLCYLACGACSAAIFAAICCRCASARCGRISGWR